MNYGKKIEINGKVYFKPQQTENGLCFKNELAFYQGNGEICYIPDGAFTRNEPTTINGEECYCADDLVLYTRNDLEFQASRTSFSAEELFDSLDGAYPSAELLSLANNVGSISIL